MEVVNTGLLFDFDIFAFTTSTVIFADRLGATTERNNDDDGVNMRDTLADEGPDPLKRPDC